MKIHYTHTRVLSRSFRRGSPWVRQGPAGSMMIITGPIRFSWTSIIVCLVLTGAAVLANPGHLIDSSTFSLLADELSGDLAKEYVISITRHHRIQGSRGYSDAAQYVLDTLRGFGFSEADAWIESFPSDGKIEYQTWQSPSGWSIDSGELHMVEPSQEMLVRYPEIGMSVITYSNSGHVRAELVDVGTGVSEVDYEGKEVSGKFVLATGYGGDVHRLAVIKYGAAAVVCYLDDDRAPNHPDMIQYTGMWPRAEELARVTFGFNLSNRQGRYLKNLLGRGHRVVLEGKVEGTGLEPWKMDVVVAMIRGRSSSMQELLYTAHLDHPKESANDNASGSAALLEIARTFKTLIGQEKLRRPEHSIRFLWVPEYYGTMAYIDKHPEIKGPELGGKILANLNLDMVGENLELLHSRLNITLMPQSISSAVGDVAVDMAALVDTLPISNSRTGSSNFNYRVTPFSGGSDHMIFNDGAIRIPALMFNHWPDYTHHTTEDTPDKVDPLELERCSLIAASTFWYLANLTQRESAELANLVAGKAQSRLIEASKKAGAWLLEAQPEDLEQTYYESRDVIDFALKRERRALQSVLDYASSDFVRRLVDTWNQVLEGQAELQRRALHAVFYQRTGESPVPRILNPEEAKADRRRPRRLTRGPLANRLPESRLPEEEQGWYLTPEVAQLNRYLLVNLIDGERSILDVRDDLAAAGEAVPLAIVVRFIEDLAKTGLVELQENP